MRYVFKDNPAVLASINNANQADAQVIGDTVAHLPIRTPDELVRQATSPKHQLHLHFEWEDRIGAHKWRLRQARALISAIRILEEDGETRPAFVSIAVHQGEQRQYVTSAEVAASRQLQLRVLKQAEADLRAWEYRYRELAELCPLVAQVRSKIIDMRNGLERT